MNGPGHPVEVVLMAGQGSDICQAEALLADHAAEVVIGDKGYDMQALVYGIEGQGAKAAIPPRANRLDQREIDPDLYREWNVVERFWVTVHRPVLL